MNGPPTGFWGKLSKGDTGEVVGWHTVDDHCADVAACCEALLTRTLLSRRLARLAGSEDLTPVQVGRLAYLVALHDIGKFGIGFQNKALAKPPFTCGHVGEVMALFGNNGYPESGRLIEALPIEAMMAWGEDDDAVVRLLAATICHHGKPYLAGGSRDPRNWRPDRGLDPFAGIRHLATRALGWFPVESDDPADLLPGGAPFHHGFSGVVMLADWLGSDEAFFPFSEHASSDRVAFARRRAQEVLLRMGLDPLPARQSLGSATPSFNRVADFDPRPMQQHCLDLPLSEHGGLAILEAETGSGKTEAALARFLRLFHAGLVDGLYFALPTRTAATQIHRRVYEATGRMFPESEARPPVVLAVPGYLAVDEVTGQRLARFEVLWNDDDRERFRYRGWAAESAKRYLAGSIVVGTIDQVLLSSLMVGHAHLRASALLRHLLVVDEVHASDAYMTRILEQVLRRHLAAGGQALLMSATVGAEARYRLMRTADASAMLPALETARAEPFPAIAVSGEGSMGALLPVSSSATSKPVAITLDPTIDRPDRIARLALDAAARGAKVIVIRNTVAGCLATQEAIEERAGSAGSEAILFRCQGLAAPHHSRFAREDRVLLDQTLEGSYGKDRPDGGCVVVATQTVQQSLDLDADLMLTDLCPMDVLLQRIGRLHRHERDVRPTGFDRPHVVILVPEDRDLSRRIGRGGAAWGKHGIGSVYDDLRILEATWRCLERHRTLVIPSMNRDLVEYTTHPEALEAIVQELGSAWHAHQRHVSGIGSADGRLAELNMVDTNRHFGEFEFPSGELARVVQTRLGEGDRQAEFERPLSSPFNESIRRLTIPYHLARSVPAEAKPHDVAPDGNRLFFSLGPHRYCYDRLGLRLVEGPPQPPREDGMEDV